MLQLKIIQDEAQLANLSREWTALADAQDYSTPFHSPAWLMTWWKHFGSGRLRVFAFRDGGELVGLIPTFLHDWNNHRQLTLLGTGISDYLEPLLDRTKSEDTMDLLSKSLNDLREWEVCNWQDLAADSPLQSASPALSEVESSSDTPCSSLSIPQSFETGQLSSNLLRNLRRYRAKAEAVGTLKLIVLDQPDQQQLEHLLSLHHSRWEERGQPGMVVANHSKEFLIAASRSLAQEGMILLFHLTFNGQPVASILTFVRRQTAYGYASGFSPEYKQYGFGTLLLYEALRELRARGYEQFDFLRGEESYKTRWGAVEIPKRRIVIRRYAEER